MGTMCKVEGSLCLNRHSAQLWGPHQANVLTSRSPIYKTRIALHYVHACTHTHTLPPPRTATSFQRKDFFAQEIL